MDPNRIPPFGTDDLPHRRVPVPPSAYRPVNRLAASLAAAGQDTPVNRRQQPDSSDDDDSEPLYDSSSHFGNVKRTAQELVIVDPDEIGMTADCKNLYSGKEDKRGRFHWQTTIPKDVGKPAEDADSQRYAIIVRHVKTFKDPKKVLTIHSILVQSPLLKKLLAEVLAGYPDFTVGLKRLEFTGRFEPLIHRWAELLAAIDQLKQEVSVDQPDSPEARQVQHAELLSNLITEEFKDVIEGSQDMKSQGVMTFDLLWTLFQPGLLVFCKYQGQDRIFRLKSSQYSQDHDGKPIYLLRCSYVEWGGAQFGTDLLALTISSYEGTYPIISLPVFPLDCHGGKEQIKSKLIDRGTKFEGLAGSHFCAYDGVGWRIGSQGNRENYTVKGRIIVDAFGWNRYNPTSYISIRPFPSLSSKETPMGTTSLAHRWNDPSLFDPGFDVQGGVMPEDGFFGDEEKLKSERLALTDEQKMMCTPIVRGYALKEKLWLSFFVNSVQPVTFDDRAFESLQLPNNQKELLLGLTATHQLHRNEFDDVISGKGRGIIILLCGPPGVGKTLTAESIAEHMEVPLFLMAAGDLGIDPRSVETKLNEMLDMCTRWGAILLLDEADVFLEERSLHELERNKLVSIFLRVLEYFQGIMFLTTNRVSTFDAAFQSRIHISIEYQELDLDARTAVWRNFLRQHDLAQAKARATPPRPRVAAATARGSRSAGPGVAVSDEAAEDAHVRQTQAHRITKKEMAKLGSFKINGRQIKNFLKTAQLLASSRAEPLSYQHINDVLEMTQHLHNASRENSLTRSSYFT